MSIKTNTALIVGLAVIFAFTACNRGKGSAPQPEAYKDTINFWKNELERVRNGDGSFDFHNNNNDAADQSVYYAKNTN